MRVLFWLIALLTAGCGDGCDDGGCPGYASDVDSGAYGRDLGGGDPGPVCDE